MGGACRALRGAGELCSALVCSCMYVRQGFTPCPFLRLRVRAGVPDFDSSLGLR